MSWLAPKYDSKAGFLYQAHVLNFLGVSTFCRFFCIWYLTAHAFLGVPPEVSDFLGLAAIFSAGITLDFIKDARDHLRLGLPMEGHDKQAVRARLYSDYRLLVWAVNATWWLLGAAWVAEHREVLSILWFFVLVGASYKLLKRIPIAKNLIMPFMSVSGALLVPAWVYGCGFDPRGVLVLGGMMFAFEVHIDIPDIAMDRLEGSRTLASMLGPEAAWRAAIGVILVAIAVAAQAAATTSSALLLPPLVFWLFSIATKQRNHRFLPWYELMMLALVALSSGWSAGA